MRDKPYLWLPFLLSLSMAVGMLIGVKMFPSLGHVFTRQVLDSFQQKQDLVKLEEVLRFIQARYVDSLTFNDLTDETLEALVSQLDPHSAYFKHREVKHEELEREGHYEGIGVEFTLLQDTVYVYKIVPGSPAESIGLKPGDAVLSIDSIKVSGAGKSYSEIIKIIPDHPEPQFHISYIAHATTSMTTQTIKKEIVQFPTIAHADLIKPGIGFIKLTRFNQSSYREFMQALEELQKRNLKHLIIDLRGNPGGYLQQAVQILSQLFREKGLLLVYTAGRHGRTEYKSTGRPFFSLENIVVLIDEYSASASEIVAGAIQDLDRGVIVGRRSFGKGLVQKQFKLSDGSAVLLTVEKYYTPSGRAIQRDYLDRDRYLYDVLYRLKDGELTGQANIPVTDTMEYFTTKGRIVHAGGGITPDVFVPLDVWASDTLLNQALHHLDEYVLSGYVHHASEVTAEGFRHYLQTNHQLVLPVNPSLQNYLHFRLAATWAGITQGPKNRLAMELGEDPVVKAALKEIKL